MLVLVQASDHIGIESHVARPCGYRACATVEAATLWQFERVT